MCQPAELAILTVAVEMIVSMVADGRYIDVDGCSIDVLSLRVNVIADRCGIAIINGDSIVITDWCVTESEISLVTGLV